MPETKIKILPDSLKDKIRAGEVVERPASVVKELIENSIDAGAMNISLEIKAAGRKLISVSDDGEGMSREDAILSLKRHSTSKLRAESDLFDIRTMGFRGEALPSIASVSRLRLITALRGEKEGVLIEAEGAEIKDIRATASVGTKVEIRDLFFNTPARRKFLKKDSTELLHIVDTLTRLSISHPKIGFSLNVEGSETMRLPQASSLRERLCQIYGSEFIDGLTEIKSEKEGLISIKGFVSKKDNLRETRTHQMIFVNRRPVKDPSLSHAIYSVYEGTSSGKHPIFFIFLEIEPRWVDFNVHPTKQEVRFQDKESIYRFVKDSVGNALREKTIHEPIRQQTVRTGYEIGGTPSQQEVAEALTLPYRVEPRHLYVGDVFIAVSENGGLTIIDHHAAHERVLYEKILNGMVGESIQLLFPRQVKLSSKEHMAIVENLELIRNFGIEAEDFGHDTLIIRALPSFLEEADIRGILADVASALMEGGSLDMLKKESAARIACHSSVRGSRILGPEQVGRLLNDLAHTEQPDTCPHGRPTRIRLSIEDLRRMFKRR